MSIIKKYNKSNGTTYVYESVSYWDKEKQQPRSKRKLIGKLDPVTGEIVPTGTRGRKSNKDTPETATALVPDSAPEIAAAIPEDSDDSADYRQLYVQTRSLLLEKEALVASLESTVAQLRKDKQEMVAALERILGQYRR